MICSMRFILYHGSTTWTWRMNLKSRPSAPAKDISTTFTFSPLTLSRLVAAFKSATLSGEIDLSPVIITYFAGLKPSVAPSPFGLSVIESIGSVGAVSNRFFIPLDRVNPSSSRARATGIMPPSIYCEYISTTPVDFIILLQMFLILPLYFPISPGEKILP